MIFSALYSCFASLCTLLKSLVHHCTHASSMMEEDVVKLKEELDS
jgi:hypothetical protein